MALVPKPSEATGGELDHIAQAFGLERRGGQTSLETDDSLRARIVSVLDDYAAERPLESVQEREETTEPLRAEQLDETAVAIDEVFEELGPAPPNARLFIDGEYRGDVTIEQVQIDDQVIAGADFGRLGGDSSVAVFWGEAVQRVRDLPATALEGEHRFVEETEQAYVYLSNVWISLSSSALNQPAQGPPCAGCGKPIAHDKTFAPYCAECAQF